MTTKQLAIIDAAISVAVFSKTHNWPEAQSKEFVEFSEMLDWLATTINAEYPNFNRNVAAGKANDASQTAAPNTTQPKTHNES